MKIIYILLEGRKLLRVNINDKEIKILPNLINDKANSSCILTNNKFFVFLGFFYEKNDYVKNIEYIDYNTKEKWIELKDINYLTRNISFDIESVSTLYYNHNQDKIHIYAGIQGEEEEFITEYYLVYDTKNNTIDKIKKMEFEAI